MMAVWKRILNRKTKNEYIQNNQTGEKWIFSPESCAETTEYLPNPGQGWYRIFTYDAGDAFIPSEGENFLREERLALVRISIGKYRNSALSESCLENIYRILKTFDSGKIDIILRVAYDFEGKGFEREPDLFSQVRDHMLQIAPIIQEFKNRIIVFQGLLVGSWGEMHQSKFLTEKWLRDLESAFRGLGNDTIWLAVRRPVFLRMLMKLEGNSLGKRTLFNDAIGSSQSDMGTFGWKDRSVSSWKEAWKREDELLFMEEVCKRAPFGGELLLAEKGYTLTSMEIVKYMQRMHLSYLNSQYEKAALDLWKKSYWQSQDIWCGSSLYDYIGNHMGYRFCVRHVFIERQSGNSRCILAVEIENTGFGNLLQEAEAELVWINQDGEETCQFVEWDAREWLCGNKVICRAQIYPQNGYLYLRLKRKWDKSIILFSNRMERNMFRLGTMLLAGGKQYG